MKKIFISVMILMAVAALLFFFTKEFNKEKTEEVLIENHDGDTQYVEPQRESKELDEQKFIRVDSQGNVDVAVVFNNLVEGNQDDLVFKLMVNTHSVALDDIDFGKLSTIKNSSGLMIEEGITWEMGGGGGHHIYGYLKVPKNYNGKDIIEESTKSVELEIKGLDGIDSRKFVWDEEDLKYLKDNE